MATAKSKLVPVTQRALTQRINRALAKQDEQLCKLRGERWKHDLGDFYILNFNLNCVVSKHVNPIELGRELGVLAEYECVED